MKCNKECIVFFLVLAGLPGCGKHKKKSLNTYQTKKVASLNIPLGENRDDINDDSIRNFFGDQDDVVIDTLVAQAEQEMKEMPPRGVVVAQAQIDDLGDFSRINGSVAADKESSVIYFDFDDYAIKKEQEEAIHAILAEAQSKNADIYIDGHACTSGGTDAYNFAIAANRGNEAKKRLVALGFPENRIKVTPRGSEMPVIINGKALEGDKIAQAPNRRAECRLA